MPAKSTASTDERRMTARSLSRVTLSVLFALTVGLGFTAGCGSADESQRTVIVDASEGLPFQSLSDWKSYADAVVVLRVTDERAESDPAAPDSAQIAPLRYVATEFEEVIWSRLEQPPTRLDFLTQGWEMLDGKQVPAASSEGPRLEVGERYLAAVVVGGVRPGVMTASSVLLIDGDTVTAGERSTPFVQSNLEGRSLEDVANAVRAAEPDPLAAKYERLPPMERYSAVVEERSSLEASGPED
jgi:hypothetical protein